MRLKLIVASLFKSVRAYEAASRHDTALVCVLLTRRALQHGEKAINCVCSQTWRHDYCLSFLIPNTVSTRNE